MDEKYSYTVEVVKRYIEYVDANSEDEAFDKAEELAFADSPDSIESEVLDVKPNEPKRDENVGYLPTSEVAMEYAHLEPDSEAWIFHDVSSLIQRESLDGKLHCDWYSDRKSNDKNLTDAVYNVVKALELGGYHTKVDVMNPGDMFPNLRVRLHISWEDKKREER